MRDGAADIGALRRDVNTDVAEGVPVLDLNVTGRRVTATTDVEAAMLRLLAAIVALAGVGFVGQALARSAATIGADAPTLRALGMSRRELVVAALRPHLLTCATARGDHRSRPSSSPPDGSRWDSPQRSTPTAEYR